MNFIKVHQEFDSLENLGFVIKEFYKIANDVQKLSFDEVFEQFIQSDAFWDFGVRKKYKDNKVVCKTPYKFKSCFNDKIEKEDFQQISFLELEYRLNKISKEESWGIDLVVFNKLKANTISWIEKQGYSEHQFFFIYSDNLDNTKLIDPHFYAYYILILIIDIKNNKIIEIHHGED